MFSLTDFRFTFFTFKSDATASAKNTENKINSVAVSKESGDNDILMDVNSRTTDVVVATGGT